MALAHLKWCIRHSKSSSIRHLSRLLLSTSEGSTSQLSNASVRALQNELFNKEQARQLALITRTEKIEVKLLGSPEDALLIMNKGLSTPYHCAMHVSQHLRDASTLALVNGKPYDMHRPLSEDCELKFLHFRDGDPRLANKAYWRSCSFLLGLIAQKAFKDQYYIELHSWPSPNVRSGSFVYDVDLKMEKWEARPDELRVLTVMARKIKAQNLNFEPLDVDASVAVEIFELNQFKKEQVPQIAASSPSGHKVRLYRLGDHIDISRGPMISRSGHFGMYDVTAVYPLQTDFGVLHRFQGVSLPDQLYLNHFAYSIIRTRSSRVNPGRVPQKPSADKDVFETPLYNSNVTTEKS